jgi:hypothetical protein
MSVKRGDDGKRGGYKAQMPNLKEKGQNGRILRHASRESKDQAHAAVLEE